MKVIVAGQKELIVSLSVIEFEKMVNVTLGDYYGNHGISYTKLTNMEFDLEKTLEAIYQLKVAGEVKNKVKQNLKEMIDRLDKVYFPISEIEDYKGKVAK